MPPKPRKPRVELTMAAAKRIRRQVLSASCEWGQTAAQYAESNAALADIDRAIRAAKGRK